MTNYPKPVPCNWDPIELPVIGDYNGITIIVSHPSRHDRGGLVGGAGGNFFKGCLHPYKFYNCDIRSMNSNLPLREGTRVVILMGQQALRCIDIDPHEFPVYRGSPISKDGVVYIPTYHYQDAIDRKNYEIMLNKILIDDETDNDTKEGGNSVEGTKNRSATSRNNYPFWFRADIHKAKRLAEQGLVRNECSYIIQPKLEDFARWVAKQRDQRVFFDIETNPNTDLITVFSVSVNAKQVWTLPLINYRAELIYGKRGTAKVFQLLMQLFNDNVIVIHNACFDLYILAQVYKLPIPRIDQIEDTMIMHHRCFPDIEKSLAHCITLYTNQPYHKDEGTFFPKNSAQDEALFKYNAKDVETLALVYSGIMATGKKMGTLSSMKQGNRCIRPGLLKSLRGVKADTKLLLKTIDDLTQREQWFEKIVLPLLVGDTINPRSPAQVANYLFNGLRLKGVKKDTNKKNLYSLLTKHEIPALRVILYLRRLSTLKGKLQTKLINGDRFTGTYNIAGTKSFRFGSTQILSRVGTNMQNFNKKSKVMIIPDPGHQLWQIDYSGVEALIVAYLCPPKSRFRALFVHGIKPHVYIALHLFKHVWVNEFGSDLITRLCEADIGELKSFEEWPAVVDRIKASDEDVPTRRFYYFAKMTCHSGNYGIGPRTFVMNILDKSEGEIVLSNKEGSRFLATHHEVFPEIKDSFQFYVETMLESGATLTNFFGFPRKFNGNIHDNDLKKEAYSWIPQSTGSACSAQIADSLIQQHLDEGKLEHNFSILQNNHDSLMGQVKLGHEMETLKIVSKYMQHELTNPWGEKFTLGVECQLGDNWKEMKEVKI